MLQPTQKYPFGLAEPVFKVEAEQLGNEI